MVHMWVVSVFIPSEVKESVIVLDPGIPLEVVLEKLHTYENGWTVTLLKNIVKLALLLLVTPQHC